MQIFGGFIEGAFTPAIDLSTIPRSRFTPNLELPKSQPTTYRVILESTGEVIYATQQSGADRYCPNLSSEELIPVKVLKSTNNWILLGPVKSDTKSKPKNISLLNLFCRSLDQLKIGDKCYDYNRWFEINKIKITPYSAIRNFDGISVDQLPQFSIKPQSNKQSMITLTSVDGGTYDYHSSDIKLIFWPTRGLLGYFIK